MLTTCLFVFKLIEIIIKFVYESYNISAFLAFNIKCDLD